MPAAMRRRCVGRRKPSRGRLMTLRKMLPASVMPHHVYSVAPPAKFNSLLACGSFPLAECPQQATSRAGIHAVTLILVHGEHLLASLAAGLVPTSWSYSLPVDAPPDCHVHSSPTAYPSMHLLTQSIKELQACTCHCNSGTYRS